VSAAAHIGAFALIFNEHQDILLCHRRDLDLWNLPGGGMEAGETPWQAVVREVEEEVGWMTEDLKAAILREMKCGRLGQPEDVARR